MKSLPNDIKGVIIFNVILKIVLSLFLYSAMIIFVIFYYDKLIITTQKGNFIIYIVIFVILSIPFSVLKIHRIFMDSNWEGVVIKKIHKEILDPKILFKPIKQLVERKYITNIIIFDKKGKEHILSFDDEYESIGEYYKNDDEVQHYYGLKYLYNKNNITKKCICIYCGTVCDNSESVCYHCKHTLLK